MNFMLAVCFEKRGQLVWMMETAAEVSAGDETVYFKCERSRERENGMRRERGEGRIEWVGGKCYLYQALPCGSRVGGD